MNHCQYMKKKMSNPADCTTGDSVQVKNYTTWLNTGFDILYLIN
jgi:hypothetical protein